MKNLNKLLEKLECKMIQARESDPCSRKCSGRFTFVDCIVTFYASSGEKDVEVWDSKNDKKIKHNEKNKKTEEKEMEKTMKIEGMMCMHCEARVKKCLEALPEVTEAIVSHENGTAVVKLGAELTDEVLKNTVEAQDYKVTGIE